MSLVMFFVSAIAAGLAVAALIIGVIAWDVRRRREQGRL